MKKVIFSLVLLLSLIISPVSIFSKHQDVSAKQQDPDYINYVNFDIDGKKVFIPSILRKGSTYISIRDLIPYLDKTHLYYSNNIILLHVFKNHNIDKKKVIATIDLNKANNGQAYLAVDYRLGTVPLIPVGKQKNEKKPILYNNKTYVNIDDINKVFFTTAVYNPKTKTVYITYKGRSYKEIIGKKAHIYLNHSDSLKLYNDLNKKMKLDYAIFSSYNAGFTVGKAVHDTFTIGKTITPIGAIKVGMGLAGLDLPSLSILENSHDAAMKIKHADFDALSSVMNSFEYQGRGVHFEIDKNGNIQGKVKQQ